MAVDTAERIDIDKESWLLVEESFPEIDQLAEERKRQMLGNLALREMVAIEKVDAVNSTTLLAAIQEARLGDKDALQVVRTNVATDIAERFYKAGHQTEVELQVADGLYQNGRPVTDISLNTLKHTILNNEMLERTTTQLRNAVLFEELLPTGILDTHAAVVFEMCPEDPQTRRDYNFFEETLTCSIQLLSIDQGKATLETALVAGKATVDALRHDKAVVRQLVAGQGIKEFRVDRASETVRQVILIPKAQIPLGVASIVEKYDEAAGGTFYGQAVPRGDYQAHVELCRQRNAGFKDLIDKVTSQLLNESHVFSTPLEAIIRLDELSEWVCVERAVRDKDINAAVFGYEAAGYIDQARYYAAHQQPELAQMFLGNARRVANSSSCPLLKTAEQALDDTSGTSTASNNEATDHSQKKWMKCPFCSAKVYDDPCAKSLSCWDCNASVHNGIVNKGDGGERARRAERVRLMVQQLFVSEVVKAEPRQPIMV